MLHKLATAILSVLLSGMVLCAAEPASPRQELSLDGPGWKVWLDREAAWQDDTLYAPGEFKLAELPVHPPTGGWEMLGTQGKPCATPACVEQWFSQGDAWWNYHGVSWFVKSVEIPAGWQGKHLRLGIARARLRVEVFVNRQLAGYDLCLESPCGFDLTPFLKPGQPNEIALRLTNPGGSRGWDDTKLTRWGAQRLPSGRDFAGIDTVVLTATDPVHVDSVFVMNLQPANGNRLQIIPTIANPTADSLEAEFTAEIRPAGGGAPLHVETWKGRIPAGGGEAASPAFSVPGAKLWTVETPNLYACRLTMNAGAYADDTKTRFGFRVFEVKPRAEDGKLCFYLNGIRFRHRSAIDFGFYAHTGLAATDGEVRRSIQAAKDIGHNGINLHRHIGEYRMLNAADEMGLALYEEPGGLHQDQGGEPIVRGSLADKVIQEKVRRMAVRDRNHPSLLIHNLSNEDNHWDGTREEALRAIHRLNPTVFVCNASGDSSGHQAGSRQIQPNRHFLPYGTELLESGFHDPHTVGSTARFSEHALSSHSFDSGRDLFYFGEMFCYCGPANWWLATEQAKETGNSYDLATYATNHDKITKAFVEWNLAAAGSRLIHSPAEVSRQAGRGLMYADGRLSQRVMARDNIDGFAINGWSAHSYCTPASCTPNNDAWDSAIVDAARNLKGPAEDYRLWTRPAQVALFRQKAKHLAPGETASFEAALVNEGRIPAGDYRLELTVTDGAGHNTGFGETRPVAVKGGEVYAQPLGTIAVPVAPEWHAGHLTLCAELKDANGKTVADGHEQVLLQNRKSWKADLAGTTIAVANWPAAETALLEAGTTLAPAETAQVILAGPGRAGTPNALPFDKMLARVNSGATLIVKFDAGWAATLLDGKLLSAPVIQWGGAQSDASCGWFSNGWGYIDHFVGNQGVPSKTILGTNSWEVPGNPTGFYPFESQYKKTAYGLYLARPDTPAKTGDAAIKSFVAKEEALAGTAEAGLFRACGYDLPDFFLKVPNGDCQVTFRGAELFQDAAGKRVFDIQLQGQTVVEKLDLFARAGGKFKPVDLTAKAKVVDGRLRIGFAASSDLSCLSGIVVDGIGADGKPWSRKLCLGQKAWQDYTAPKADEAAPDDPATLLVLLATLDYGQGKIVLAPSYPVDANHPFNDLFFYNLILKAIKKEW